MTLKAGNLIIFGTEALGVAREIKAIAKKAIDAGQDLKQLPGLGDSAQAEVDAVAVQRVKSLKSANTGVMVLKEIVKTSTPLIKKVEDGEDPDFGKFIEVDENGDEVKPRIVVIDPSSYE